MDYRRLGDSGLKVSEIGLGCNNFGMRIDQDATNAVIDAAIEHGVTFFDTADVYGGRGKSEEMMGVALKGKRDKVVLATKFASPMGDTPDKRGGSRRYIMDAVEASLTLQRAISGPIAADTGGTTRICASIVDAASPYGVAYAAPDLASEGADLHVEDSTIVGRAHTRTIQLASNTIFHAHLGARDPWPAPVWASRRQTGCVRFCSLPFASITPRRYRCLPPDAASETALEPRFVTLRYGGPSYALLSGDVPMAVWRGADNGSQIGVYGQIQETEAVRNVQLRAPEYLPARLECGVFLKPSRPLPQLVTAQPYYYGRYAAAGDEQHFGIGIGLI